MTPTPALQQMQIKDSVPAPSKKLEPGLRAPAPALAPQPVMAVLALFKQCLMKILFNSFASNSESLTKYDAFCSHLFHLWVLERPVQSF